MSWKQTHKEQAHTEVNNWEKIAEEMCAHDEYGKFPTQNFII